MKKIIFNLLFFASVYSFAQTATDTILIKMQPSTFKQIVLYAAEGAQQKYVTHAKSEDGIFKLAIPKDAPKASYRLVFNQETMDYFDFLYVGKPFEVQFSPTDLKQIPTFTYSDENTRYLDNLFKINGWQQKMDAIQIEVFKTQDNNILDELYSSYSLINNELKTLISQIENQEQNQLIKDILKANVRALPEKPIQDPTVYLPLIKEHFFDSIDFSNQNLINSSILVDKVMDYVFYLTVADDVKTQNDLSIKASHDVLDKIKDPVLQKGFIQALIQSFAQDENVYVIDDLFANYYDKLKVELQNQDWKNNLQKELSTAISRKAPNFEFSFNKRQTNLYDLKGYKYYVVAFWSTTCSHCLHEIPMFYDYIKEHTDTKVIAVGMETTDSKYNWQDDVVHYPNFINVLGLGKWENPIAQSYNVHASPNYYVLDENKIIIAKPYDFQALEAFFDTLK
jgi:thiol-disulfide isomerase/thioredoxin